MGKGGKEGGKGENRKWVDSMKNFLRSSHPREKVRNGNKTPDSSSSYPGRRYFAGLARSMKSVNNAQLPDEQDDRRRDVYADGGWILRIVGTNEHRFIERAERSLNLSYHLSNNQWHGRSIGKCNLLSCNKIQCFSDGIEATYKTLLP